jgi:hypothetical protein
MTNGDEGVSDGDVQQDHALRDAHRHQGQAPSPSGLIWRAGGEAPSSVSAVNATAWPTGTREPYERPASGPLARRPGKLDICDCRPGAAALASASAQGNWPGFDWAGWARTRTTEGASPARWNPVRRATGLEPVAGIKACGSGDPLLCLVIDPSICDLAMVGIAGRSRRTDDRQLPRPSRVRVLRCLTESGRHGFAGR